MSDIAKKLRALADEIEAKPQSEPEPTWPPKGVSIEVDANCNKQYLPRTSAGDGFYCYPQGGLQCLKDTPWRYAPAPWDIAPAWANCWVIIDSGESCWVSSRWKKGERMSGGGTIVHVEYRPETEEINQ